MPRVNNISKWTYFPNFVWIGHPEWVPGLWLSVSSHFIVQSRIVCLCMLLQNTHVTCVFVCVCVQWGGFHYILLSRSHCVSLFFCWPKMFLASHYWLSPFTFTCSTDTGKREVSADWRISWWKWAFSLSSLCFYLCTHLAWETRSTTYHFTTYILYFDAEADLNLHKLILSIPNLYACVGPIYLCMSYGTYMNFWCVCKPSSLYVCCQFV